MVLFYYYIPRYVYVIERVSDGALGEKGVVVDFG